MLSLKFCQLSPRGMASSRRSLAASSAGSSRSEPRPANCRNSSVVPNSHRPTNCLTATELLDERPRQQRFERVVAVHTADRFDVSAGAGLAVGNDRKHLQRSSGKALRLAITPQPPHVARRAGMGRQLD